MYKVQKKDGRLEDFDRNHVYQSVIKAGGTNEEAEKVTVAVESWLPGAVVSGVVTTQAIREKVLDLLRTFNPVVAGDFEVFKKQI